MNSDEPDLEAFESSFVQWLEQETQERMQH